MLALVYISRAYQRSSMRMYGSRAHRLCSAWEAVNGTAESETA